MSVNLNTETKRDKNNNGKLFVNILLNYNTYAYNPHNNISGE